MKPGKTALPAAVLTAAIIVLSTAGSGQEGADVLDPLTGVMLAKIQHNLVLAGKALSTKQYGELLNVLKPELEKTEAEQREKYRDNIIWLMRKKTDVDRYEANGQTKKHAQALQEFEGEKRRIEAAIEKELLKVRDGILAGMLTEEQKAVLKVAKPDEQPKEPGPRRTPARDGNERRLRESDFH